MDYRPVDLNKYIASFDGVHTFDARRSAEDAFAYLGSTSAQSAKAAISPMGHRLELRAEEVAAGLNLDKRRCGVTRIWGARRVWHERGEKSVDSCPSHRWLAMPQDYGVVNVGGPECVSTNPGILPMRRVRAELFSG